MLVEPTLKRADASLYSDPQPSAGGRDPAEVQPSAAADAIGHIDDGVGAPSIRDLH
jgi:hypothetical protein